MEQWGDSGDLHVRRMGGVVVFPEGVEVPVVRQHHRVPLCRVLRPEDVFRPLRRWVRGGSVSAFHWFARE